MNLKLKSLIFLSTTFLLLCSSSCEKKSVDIDPSKLSDPIKIELRSSAEKAILRSDQNFAFDIFSNVFNEELKDEDNNFMISPFSLSMALAMTWNGAGGTTKEVMRNTLKLGDYSDDEVNGYYKKLKEALLKTDPTTKLSIANSIWTNQFVPIKSTFIKTNEEFFDATIQSVNFGDPLTVGLINKWASDNTNNLVKKVLDKTDPQDLMYLLNAIYFKGIWSTKFDSKNTNRQDFTYENGAIKKVDMMHLTADLRYSEDELMQIVELPYGNKAFSMIVLLPKKGKQLKDLNVALTTQDYLANLTAGFSKAEVFLTLPKFKTEYSKKLNDALTNMGMGEAFTDAADFSGMSDASAKIAFVKQDTYISTDEVGTEAAAVTTVGVVFTSIGISDKVVFNANHPFIYIIRENSTGAILFMGTVKNFD